MCVVVCFGVICSVMLNGVFVCGLCDCVFVCAIMCLCVCEMWSGMLLWYVVLFSCYN